MKPYVAQDENGGWYADAIGLMQDPDPTRTEAQALQWALDRLWDVQMDAILERHRKCIADFMRRELLGGVEARALIEAIRWAANRIEKGRYPT